jgi:LAO/AO transport system ATPase
VSDLADLLARFRQGDRQALSRLLTLASRGVELEALRAAATTANRAQVIALTGSGGVGKSTLVGRLTELAAAHGKKVAVLACDPESPLTGGALLGDRVRMGAASDGSLPFIRSLAAASGHQAIAEHLDVMIELLQAYGFDVIILETVGAGQGDIAIRPLVDVLVLLLQPQSGDDLQWEKAGVLEVADVVVIHKADLPGSDEVVAQVRAEVNQPGRAEIPVVKVSSAKREGLDELWQTLASRPSRRETFGRSGERLVQLAQERLSERFHRSPQTFDDILTRWQNGELSDAQAADELVRRI